MSVIINNRAEQSSNVSQGAEVKVPGAQAAPGPEAVRAVLDQARAVQGLYFIPEEQLPPKKWRQRHPKIFWLLVILFLFVFVNSGRVLYAALDAQGVFSGPRLGIARIDGMILDSEELVAWLDYLERNQSVRGVLLQINSPGGAVVPSQEIHAAVNRLTAVKPVVAYLSTAGASGGYYVAVASNVIVASPSTLTGSIGVRMELMNMQQLFDTIGIRQQGLVSGPLKEAGTPFRPLRRDEEAYLRGLVQDMYEAFINDVAAGRKMEADYVRKLADGRAYTGRQALELGLVDELGDRVKALNILCGLAGLKELPKELFEGPPAEEPFFRELISGAVRDIVQGAKAELHGKNIFYY